MTYREVLDDLIDIMSRHRMIVTWGYGNLSDLVTPFKKQNVTDGSTPEVYNIDYPYAFLQPLQHQLQTNVSKYNFNLIMMEQCTDEPMDVIQAQSNCHQYIKDVLAEIYYNYGQKYDFTLNSSVTPFKEKYNDTVSGMTANISLEIRDGLDDCIAPFAPKQELNIWAYSPVIQTIGSDSGENKAISYVAENIDLDNTWSVNRMDLAVAGSYNFETTYSFQFEAPDPEETYPNPPELLVITGAQTYYPADKTIGWPSSPEPGVTYNIKQIWNTRVIPGGTLSFVYHKDLPGLQTEMLIDAGATIKIYKII